MRPAIIGPDGQPQPMQPEQFVEYAKFDERDKRGHARFFVREEGEEVFTEEMKNDKGTVRHVDVTTGIAYTEPQTRVVDGGAVMELDVPSRVFAGETVQEQFTEEQIDRLIKDAKTKKRSIVAVIDNLQKIRDRMTAAKATPAK